MENPLQKIDDNLGYPKKWVIKNPFPFLSFMENPKQKWMITGSTPIQWIGLGEKLQENPMIFMVKTMVSG
jgi:hypothetical protein